jgi:hypothetical protein
MKTKTPQNNVRIMKKHHNTMTKTPQHNVGIKKKHHNTM